MRNTAIFWKRNQHSHVYHSGNEEIQYNYISIDRYIHEENAYLTYSVYDLLFNLFFRIALWPSVGKELSPWLFTCAVFSVLIVGVPFPFGV